jgi:chitodextrinase
VTGTGTGQTTASLDWTAGNPAGSANVTYYWVVGTSPSVLYGNGVAQGSTTGTWAGATGLSPGTTYYLRVFASTSCDNSKSGYGTSYLFSTTGSCNIPGVQANNITFTFIGTQQFTVNWVNGSGSRRVVVINKVNNFTPPVNGSDPFANNNYSGYGEQVVYNGNGSNVSITGLTPNTTYWVRIFEANCEGNKSVYNLNSGINNPNSQKSRTVLPPVQSFVASNMVMNGNIVVETIPIFSTNQPYAAHPPIDIYVNHSNKTRFALNASAAEGFSFQIVDKLKIVTDCSMAIDPPVFGQLGTVVCTATNSMYVDYTHPDQIDISPEMALKLDVLFEGGLIGMSVPLHIHMAQSPLPVDVINFDAKWNRSEELNELTWTTKSEINNDFFEVERSFESSDYEFIGKVAGAGNSSSAIEYVFKDHKISADGYYLYRLRQIDFNGKATYSKPASVNVSRSQSIKTGIFPNPASDQFSCYIEAYSGAKVNIEIFNNVGQQVNHYSIDETLTDKWLTRQLDTKHFGKGIYTVVFSIDGKRYNHKLIILD